jgi:anti-anti-sigma factor
MDQAQFESLPGMREGVRVIRVTGPFTLPSVMDFQSIVQDGPSPVTIIDLSAVPYLDSAALGAIISVHTSSQRHQRKYALTGVRDRLKVLMEMTGVADLLIMYPAMADAEAMLA